MPKEGYWSEFQAFCAWVAVRPCRMTGPYCLWFLVVGVRSWILRDFRCFRRPLWGNNFCKSWRLNFCTCPNGICKVSVFPLHQCKHENSEMNQKAASYVISWEVCQSFTEVSGSLEFYGLHWKGRFTDHTHSIIKSKNKKIEQLLFLLLLFVEEGLFYNKANSRIMALIECFLLSQQFCYQIMALPSTYSNISSVLPVFS